MNTNKKLMCCIVLFVYCFLCVLFYLCIVLPCSVKSSLASDRTTSDRTTCYKVIITRPVLL